jgi:tetratricopeptide (TPR) repeat protein
MVDHSPDHGGTPWLGWVDTSALLSQARTYELAGSLRQADAAYNTLIVAAARQQDHATLAAAFRHRAVLAHQAGDTVRARSALQQSYAVATMIGDRRLTAETLNTLGGIELETRNLTAAEAALLEAETLASEEPAVLARVAQNLGIVANMRGHHEIAEGYYRRSLAAYEDQADPHGAAIAHHNLGMLAADRGDNRRAVDHFDACEELAESSRDTHLVSLCLLNRAEILIALGRTEQARRDIASAERGFESLGAHFDAADVHRVLALCDRSEGLLGQAEARLVQARELAKITGARLTEAEAARELGRIYAETGRVKEAQEALREAAQAFEGLGAVGEAEATGLGGGRRRGGGGGGGWGGGGGGSPTPRIMQISSRRILFRKSLLPPTS